MLTKRVWIQTSHRGLRQWHREGWFLFGIIPIYVRDLQPRGRK